MHMYQKANATKRLHLGLSKISSRLLTSRQFWLRTKSGLQGHRKLSDRTRYVDKRTLNPTKHPPGQAATHSSHEPTVFNLE